MAKMLTFQVPIPEKAGHRFCVGFTLVEVLTALVMAALLAGVAAGALTSVLRVESRALTLREGTVAMHTVAATWWNTGAFPDEVSPGDIIWRVQERAPAGHEGISWRCLELVPRDRNSPVLSLYFERYQGLSL